MELVSPSVDDHVERRALAPRVDALDGTTIGLFDNGKQAAEPTLTAIRARLGALYPDMSFDLYGWERHDPSRDPEDLLDVEAWARNSGIDACIGAVGDCGSCTKLLVWGVEAVEKAGVPAVGVVDEGFDLDWKSNAIERGRPLRYYETPVRPEIRDDDRRRERVSAEVVTGVIEELTRPLTETERESAASR